MAPCVSDSTSATWSAPTTRGQLALPRKPRTSASTWSGRRRRTARTPDRARLDRRPDPTHRRRLGGHADPGPHAGDDRDDRRHPRHAVRRPVPARPRRLRPAGLRGLARRAVRQAAGPHPRVRRHRQARRSPASRWPTTASTTRCRCPTARARRSAHLRTRSASTSRSTWPRSARRTWSWPARSPTAGWPSSTPRTSPTSSSARIGPGRARGRQDAGRLRRRPQRPAGRRRRPGALRRSGPPLRRALRRRHGQPRAELLQRARGPDGLRRRRRRGAGPLPRPAAPRRVAAVPYEFIDSTSLLGPEERIAERLRALGGLGGHHLRDRSVREHA